MNTSSSPGKSYNFKVVLLGEGCVGKTSLVLRYTENKFNPKHISTVQAAFLTRKLVVDGKRVTLAIWDTAGQERFHALGPIYYRDSNAAILVYDITDEDSFSKVKNWVKELRKMLGSEVCLCIVGNKFDLEKERVVPVNEAESYAQSVGATHSYTSAKSNQGVDELFLTLTRAVIEVQDAQTSSGDNQVPRAGSQRRNILITDDPQPETTRRSTCC